MSTTLRSAFAAIMITALPASLAASATVTASPDSVTFTSLDQSFSIALHSDGAPLTAGSISGHQFLASGHDYKHMIRLVAADGSVTVSPSPECEVGSFDLVICTVHGPVHIDVLTPLCELPTTIEAEAKQIGVPMIDLERRLGIVKESPRASIAIALPALYYAGQVLQLPVPAPAEREGVWLVNGEIKYSCMGPGRFDYVLGAPGTYVFHYFEKQGDTVRASASAATLAVDRPVIEIECAAGTPVSLTAFAGYREYRWEIDGSTVDTGPTLIHTFTNPGTYLATCTAREREGGIPGEFALPRFCISVV